MNNKIRVAKKKYSVREFLENKIIIRQTWNVINKLLSKTGNRSRLEIKLIIKNNRINTNGFEICEMFNDFFTSVSSRIHDSIPPPIPEDEFS